MTEHTTRDRLVAITVKLLGNPGDHPGDDARFAEDLGANSLDMVELIMEVEDAFAIDISDDEAERVHTVGDALALIERLRAAPGRA